jgi:NADPH:quinone reductase-like Zn-dependent oxidoreductase
MARVVRIHALGGPEALQIESGDIAPPGPGEIRLRVKAFGLNRADVLLRTGRYIETAPLPSGLGLEAAGIIDAIGEEVAGLAVGDAVSVVPPTSMVRWPAYGEVATFPAHLVVKHPRSLSWIEAAAIWMPAVTAYGALIDIAAVGPGDHVVVTAASSSVGLAAIQVALMVGATPIAVTRTSAKRQALLNFGAPHVIVTDDEEIETRLADIAGPQGVRVVFDPVGGPNIAALAAAMSRGGVYFVYGAMSPEPTPFPIIQAVSKSLVLRGYLIHEITTDSGRLEAAKRFVLDGLVSGALRPVVDRTFSFEEIVEAHRYLESNAQFGKIVVTI